MKNGSEMWDRNRDEGEKEKLSDHQRAGEQVTDGDDDDHRSLSSSSSSSSLTPTTIAGTERKKDEEGDTLLSIFYVPS